MIKSRYKLSEESVKTTQHKVRLYRSQLDSLSDHEITIEYCYYCKDNWTIFNKNYAYEKYQCEQCDKFCCISCFPNQSWNTENDYFCEHCVDN